MKKILVALLVLLTACSNGQKNKDELEYFAKNTTTSGFDTTMFLYGYAKDEKEFNKYFDILKEEFWEYHKLFDKYNNYKDINNIKSINDNAGIKPLVVDDAIIDMMKEAKKFSEDSDYFDITYGAVYKIWHDYREEGIELNQQGKLGKVPTMEELKAAEKHTGWDKVEIDYEKKTVYLTEKGMELDVGGIAKGYATEMVARKLEAEGMKHAVVSGGGNIRTINHKADGSKWVIGLSEPVPEKEAGSVDAFSLDDSMSMVTSGDYERAYTGEDNKVYSHLINPKTLVPDHHFRSVTIITSDSTMADALTTSLFMMSYEEGKAFIDQINKKYPENKISVVWVVDKNEDWYHSENFDYMMTDDLIPASRELNK